MWSVRYWHCPKALNFVPSSSLATSCGCVFARRCAYVRLHRGPRGARILLFVIWFLGMCILVCVDAVTPEVLGLFATNAQLSHLKASTRCALHSPACLLGNVDSNPPFYSRCYSTTLDDDQMRTAVWWTKPKIGFLLEPHRGFPHLKASVYDCPSNGGRVVYEYMR